jgi:hypothetical protein
MNIIRDFVRLIFGIDDQEHIPNHVVVLVLGSLLTVGIILSLVL